MALPGLPYSTPLCQKDGTHPLSTTCSTGAFFPQKRHVNCGSGIFPFSWLMVVVLSRLVFVRQQERRCGPVAAVVGRLGDDPQLFAPQREVGRQYPAAVLERLVVQR